MKSILNLHFFTFNINNEKYIKIRKTSKEDIYILYSTVFNTVVDTKFEPPDKKNDPPEICWIKYFLK